MAGLKGLTRMPAASNGGSQDAFEPRCGQEAPPKARMVGVPSKPGHSRAGPEFHAEAVQAAQPGAEQGRGLHGLRKDAARCADEGFDAEAIGPGDQRLGRKGADGRFEPAARLAIAAEQLLQRLGMREVQPAAPGQQELAGGCGHVVDDGDAVARLRENFGGHEARRARAGNR